MAAQRATDQDVWSLYRSVPLRDGESRILKLSPGQYDDDIRCGLEIVNLRDCPPSKVPDRIKALSVEYQRRRRGEPQAVLRQKRHYRHVCPAESPHNCICFEAVSYAWGGRRSARHIAVKALEGFPVTQNAFAALRSLRLTDAPRRLWLDAVCINQLDNAERECQIQLMRDIYSLARCVVVWLGELDLARERSTLFRHGIIFHGLTSTPADPKSNAWQVTKPEDDRRLAEAQCELLYELDESPGPHWWKRLWVVQEFFLARRRIIAFGCYELREWAFAALIERAIPRIETKTPLVIRRHRVESGYKAERNHYGFDARYTVLQRLEGERNGAPRYSLARLLATNSGLEATDPRDTLYGLLGLMDPDRAAMIKVDYSASMSQVQMSAMHVLVAESKRLDFLSIVVTDRPHSSEGSAPSWCPELAGRGPSNGYLNVLYDRLQETINDCLPIQAVCLDHVMNDRSLSVHGIRLGGISRTLDKKQAPLSDFNQEVLEIVVCTFDCFSRPKLCPAAADLVAHGRETASGGLDEMLDQLQAISRSPAHREAELAYADRKPPRTSDHQRRGRRFFVAASNAWSSRFCDHGALPEAHPDPEKSLRGKHRLTFFDRSLDDWGVYSEAVSGSMHYFVTDTGFLGLGPASIQEGDLVILVRGSSAPIVVRKGGETGHYVFCGLAYVHGVMDDELGKLYPGLELNVEEFVIC